MNLPTLYALDKKSGIREWDIIVEKYKDYSDVIITHGSKDGKKIKTVNTINKGKNIGKKNETTHYDQAKKEAESKWTKKRDINGYMEILEENNSTISTVFRPMLANDYFKQKAKLKFPCYIQPKLDGIRMVYNSKTASMTSRQGKSYDIIRETDILMKELEQLKNTGCIFDGELYVHGGLFEGLGLLRKKTIKKEDLHKLNNIKYHIYDIIDETIGYKERYSKLQTIIGTKFSNIELIKNIEITEDSHIKQNHVNFIRDGYEGSILRNQNGLYKCKHRSNDLLKYKDFMDAEYPICGYTFEKDTSGDSELLIVWICKTPDELEFNVRPKGTHTERKIIYSECMHDFSKYKGRSLWVKFFELTDKKIPRFPTTNRDTVVDYIRDEIE